jgi:hypothetical protein
MISDARTQGATANRSPSSVTSRPSRNDPLTFTTNVPQGNDPSRLETQPSSPYRASAPSAPATPIATAVLTAPLLSSQEPSAERRLRASYIARSERAV